MPISITAISGSALQDRQVTSAQDLTKVVPNLQFSPDTPSSGNTSTAVIFIRGIGQTDFLASEDPGVGLYVGGVYYANTAGTATSLLDLSDVQVLRGPKVRCSAVTPSAAR
ncbi:MAG: TonB-dependent receptor plug domain-containing protein [Steroidobacteraceae bacterium]